MKKFLSAILSFAMIFALSIPAFAADITVAPTETVTNEYQSMLELQKISNATLAAEGYTPSEIETIRNTDQIFDDHYSRKPVFGFIAGRTAPQGRRMGHAGAIVSGRSETSEEKSAYLAACGIICVDALAAIGDTVRRTLS